MKASVAWKVGTVYEGVSESGFSVVTAARSPEGERQRGPLPLELVLIGVGSCTAMDVVGILTKMRQPFTGLTVEVDADRREEHPKIFTAIRLHYTLRGRGLDRAQVERAIQLSQERYCSVAAMLRPTVPLTYTWEIKEDVESVQKAA